MRWLVLIMFMVPAAVLVWRLVVTKSHNQALRVGAAGAAMATIVGAFVLFGDIEGLDFGDWRSVIALVAAASGSVYLIVWSQRHRGNRRHRTVSILGALFGIVPVVAVIGEFLLYRRS